jgi:hypothetical protein
VGELLLRHSFAALGCGQASPSSFLRSDGLWVKAEKESRNCGLFSSSTMPRTFIFNNAIEIPDLTIVRQDVVENYGVFAGMTAADNIRPIEIPDLTIVRQE